MAGNGSDQIGLLTWRLVGCLPGRATLAGTGLSSHRHAVLFKLTSKVRRFFGPEAVAEIWAEMQPAIAEPSDVSGRFEALGWLALFLPSHNISQ